MAIAEMDECDAITAGCKAQVAVYEERASKVRGAEAARPGVDRASDADRRSTYRQEADCDRHSQADAAEADHRRRKPDPSRFW